MSHIVDEVSFKSVVSPDWCPGCGDYGVLVGLQKSCLELKLNPKDVLCVSGIGCSSNLPGFFGSYGMHTLHGRGVAVAEGARLGNPNLTVIAVGGDGDGYGIGIGHFIHAMRRNLNMTYIVMNNQIYGLTTGQCSPTTTFGTNTKSTPDGSIENPINPLMLALSSGATFIGRCFSGNQKQLLSVYKQAIQHEGFSLVDVFSPCVTYNKVNTFQWFKKLVYDVQESGHDASNFDDAFQITKFDDLSKIATGVLYHKNISTYESLEPAYRNLSGRIYLTSEEFASLKDSFR